MENIAPFLYILIGLLVGGLAVLIVDTRYFGRRLKTALDAESKAKSELSGLVRRLSAGNVTAPAPDPGDILEEREPQDRPETRALQDGGRASEAEWAMMRDNLTRVSNHVEVLRADKHALQVQLAAAEAKALAAHEELGAIRQENHDLQEKNERLHHQLGASEVEIRYLQEDLRDALSRMENASLEERKMSPEDPDVFPEVGDDDLPLVDELFPGSKPRFESKTAGTASDQSETEIEQTIEANRLPEALEIMRPNDSIEASSEVHEVRGIGPVFAQRLNAAGINNVADLAIQTPEHLSKVVGLKSPTHNRPAAWIAQAQEATGISIDAGSRSADPDSQRSKDLSQDD